MRIFFRVDGEPATKGSWRFIRGRKRPIPDNPRTKSWGVKIWAAFRSALVFHRQFSRLAGDEGAAISIVFRIERPKSHLAASGEPRPEAPPMPTRHGTGDIDKLLRAVLDALNEQAWNDDSQVVWVLARKRWADPDEQPGADVTVERCVEVMSHAA